MNETQLQFAGDLTPAWAIVLGLAAGGAVWWFYRRETRSRGHWLAAAPPLLRAAAVALVVLMLTGPILHTTVRVGDVSKVLVVLDQSRSMSLTDESMADSRAYINAVRHGLLSDQDGSIDHHQLASRLAATATRAQRWIDNSADADDGLTDGEADKSLRQAVAEFRQGVRHALTAVNADGRPAQELERTSIAKCDELLDASEGVFTERVAEFATVVGQIEERAAELEEAFIARVDELNEQDEVAAAIAEFRDRPRWRRIESALMRTDDSLLHSLAGDHDVEVIGVSGGPLGSEPTIVWQSSREPQPPRSLTDVPPDGVSTNIASPLLAAARTPESSAHLSVVLLSDGQHNQDGQSHDSPLKLAKLLGGRGTPVFPVGFGSASPPEDLAVLTVRAPQSVFADDRVKGEILLKDNMPPGTPVTIRIDVDEEVVWEEHLQTENSTTQTVEFDFSVKQLIEDRNHEP
ncbi:MAG: hypothetical protein QF805_02765 [Pirellulaceae bacterium]|jgi:hypothetical protein|nr:hypothetical protein [Pirellulaceae bacterium]